ncbi:carbohydrate porin [Thalassoporum mexicanum]|uniref:carbohydrate porin n=1 Tax=Thalassoporum mexicanum TaxID=3457544 RepID=UPI0029F5C180|nr:carbohydrate porin [Pseudanabaena sp. PCC 7367]
MAIVLFVGNASGVVAESIEVRDADVFTSSDAEIAQNTSPESIYIQPNGWEFSALFALADRHDCIPGHDDTSRFGRIKINRYDFAAVLDQCIDRVNLILNSRPNQVSEQDLENIRRLEEEFASELEDIRGRQAKTKNAQLELQQFSVAESIEVANSPEFELPEPPEAISPESDFFQKTLQPDDWEMTTLASLEKRYRCVTKGHSPNFPIGKMTLYEFTRKLYICVNNIEEILIDDITQQQTEKVSANDLSALRKLQVQFASELAVMQKRIDYSAARHSALRRRPRTRRRSPIDSLNHRSSNTNPTAQDIHDLIALGEIRNCIGQYLLQKQGITRNEFAQSLSNCLDVVNEIISANGADEISRGELVVLQRLQEEYAAELATLRGRVDSLEAATARLEALQFAPTTKFADRAILALSGAPDYDSRSSTRDSIASDPTDINDWPAKAEDFMAIEQVIKKHGCIANYPFDLDRSTINRLDFSWVLEVCLDYLSEVISSGLAERFSKQDLSSMQRLQERFAAELASRRAVLYPIGADPYSHYSPIVLSLRSPKLAISNSDQEHQPLAQIEEGNGDADGEVVNPTYWARVDLERLAHKYGCVPLDPKYSSLPIPRDEFIAKLSPCLKRISRLPIARSLSTVSSSDDSSIVTTLRIHDDGRIQVSKEDSDLGWKLYNRFGSEFFVFRSIKTSDWEYKALVKLIEKYECIQEYKGEPEKDVVISRREFAAGLNACLDKINEIISSGLVDTIAKEDLAALARLQEEFAADIAGLSGLEALPSPLRANFYSDDDNLADGEIIKPSGYIDGYSVAPNDAIYKSLLDLGKRYGCEELKRTDSDRHKLQALSRYEFSLGVRDCLKEIYERIDLGKDELPREDILALWKLEGWGNLHYNDVELAKSTIEQSTRLPTPAWVYPIMTRLSKRIGCISFAERENQDITRAQFAMTLDRCLDKLNEIISAGLLDKVTTEETSAFLQLRREFKTELAAIKKASSRNDFQWPEIW